MSIRCITFDLDDTLWDIEPVIERAEREVYAWLLEHHPRITERFSAEALVDHRRAFIASRPHDTHDLTLLRKAWLGALAAETGAGEALVEPAFRVYFEGRNRVALYDGAVETLERLSGQYRLGAVTNGNACVHHIGIGHCFEFVVSSADAGASKPDPAIFARALEHAGAEPAEVLHVGDDPVRDVAGAAESGMRTAWVNPGLAPWPGGQTPDLVVRHVQELVDAVPRLG